MHEASTDIFKLSELLEAPYYCSGCAMRVCEGARVLPGVRSAECDLEAGTLAVVYERDLLPERELAEQIRLLALAQAHRTEHAAYRVTGLD